MRQYLTALKFSLKEQLTNKFALGLLAVFVPFWYWMLGAITGNAKVAFKFQPTGGFVQANGHDLVLISAGLNVVAMILGFMFFHSAHRSLAFDKRLTRAGLGRFSFMSAKADALVAMTAAVAIYMVLILVAFWRFPHNTFEVWLGFWLVSLIYAALGLLLGMLIDNELVGFFIIIMFSMMDTFLQNPIGNPAANKAFLAYFPSYSAMQLSVAGGFTHLFAVSQLWLGLAWFAGFLLIALGVFYFRTRRKSSVINERSS
jgi:ABC-2 type transport system permease protein